jgi:hypothetical protein
MEPSIAYSEARELPRVPVWVSATLNSGRNQSKLQ